MDTLHYQTCQRYCHLQKLWGNHSQVELWSLLYFLKYILFCFVFKIEAINLFSPSTYYIITPILLDFKIILCGALLYQKLKKKSDLYLIRIHMETMFFFNLCYLANDEIQSHPEQCFSNFNVEMNHLRILLKFRFWFGLAWWGSKFCLFNDLPGGTTAAGPDLTFRVGRI